MLAPGLMSCSFVHLFRRSARTLTCIAVPLPKFSTTYRVFLSVGLSDGSCPEKTTVARELRRRTTSCGSCVRLEARRAVTSCAPVKVTAITDTARAAAEKASDRSMRSRVPDPARFRGQFDSRVRITPGIERRHHSGVPPQGPRARPTGWDRRGAVSERNATGMDRRVPRLLSRDPALGVSPRPRYTPFGVVAVAPSSVLHPRRNEGRSGAQVCTMPRRVNRRVAGDTGTFADGHPRLRALD